MAPGISGLVVVPRCQRAQIQRQIDLKRSRPCLYRSRYFTAARRRENRRANPPRGRSGGYITRETGKPTRVIVYGHVEAYLPASTSDFYDDDGKPAALWRIRYTTGPIKGDSEDLELHEVEEALVTTQSVSADTESIVRAVERLDLNDEGADGLIGAVASLNLGKDDDHRDGRDATLQNTYTGAGHGRAHAGAAGAATSSPGATDAAASNLLRAAAAAAGTGASDAIDADAGTCDADAFWFARAMEPDVDWSSSASLRAFVLKHDVWPCMGHPLREPMLEAIAALEGVNPDITFSDSAALVPTEGAAEGVGVTAAIGTAARSCLDLAYGAASCCASAAFSCCSAAVSYVSDACTCFFGVLPNGAAKTAVDATSSADVAAASVEALHCAVAGGGAGGDASDEDEAHRVADAVGLARAAPRDAASSAAARAARVGAVGVGSRELSAVWVGDGDARAAGDRAPAVAAAATPVEPLALHRVALPPAVAVRAAPRLLELRLGGGGAAHAARYFAHAMRCGAAPALRSLEVDDAGLDGAVVQGLMAAVATHATLESLSIRGSPVGTAAARAVACALAQAPALARVDLRGTIAASGVGASHVCAGVAANGRLAELGGVALGRGLAALGVGGGAVAELSNAALLPNLGALVAAPAAAAGGGAGEPSDDARRRRQLQLLANVARLPFDLDELKELYRFFFCAAPPRDFDEGADAPPRAAALPRPPGAGERRALDGATPRVDAFPRLAARLRADLAARAACADPAARFDALRDVLVRLRQLRYYGMQERGDWLTRRTLVVDDSETTRRLLRRSFENAGFLVDAARDGREALVCMRRTPYDLVIMDLEMPVMDGWRSTRELRAWERDAPAGVRPQRVCAVSAEPQRRDGALRSGADAFEAKPLRVSSLLEMSTRVAAEAAERLDAALDASGEVSDAGGASSDGAAGSARPARFEPRLPPPDALEDALMLECAGVFAAPAAKRSRAAGAAEAPAPSSPLASGGVDSV